MADNLNRPDEGKKPGATKPVEKPGITESQHVQDSALRLLYLALCSTEPGEKALIADKAGSESKAITLAREALKQVLAGGQSDVGVKELKELKETNSTLKEEVAKLVEHQKQLLSTNSLELLQYVMPYGLFRRRLLDDHPLEKKELSEYVASNFFSHGPVFAFIQASTMAVHLGQALAKARMDATTLLYSNSVAFPLTVLADHGRHSVYAFCGNSFDNLCGGWLFHHEDLETTAELVKLFKRERSPITQSFLMPLATTLEDGVFYHGMDSANLARILATEAKEIILLTTADRLYERESELPAIHPWTRPFGSNSGWDQFQGKTKVVIGGDKAGIELPKYAERLHAKGLQVHWRCPVKTEWQRLG